MGYLVRVSGKPVAFVDGRNNKFVVEKVTAGVIEQCLRAYGLSVNMGVDEEITYPERIDGYTVSVPRDIDEKLVVRAIVICAGLQSGEEPEIESVDEKLYELVASKKITESDESEEGEIEFEEA